MLDRTTKFLPNIFDKVAAFDGDSTIINTLPFPGEVAEVARVFVFVVVVFVDFLAVDVLVFLTCVLVLVVLVVAFLDTGIVITPR